MIRTRGVIQPKNKFLWKYLDLYKFIDLIRSKKLHFNSLDQFDDILEGMSEEEAHVVSLASMNASLPLTRRNKNLSRWDYDSHACEVVSIYKNQKEYQKKYFVSCFYNSMFESAAMWNLYSGLDGIALRFDAIYLYQFIREFYHQKLKNNYKFQAKNLDYQNLLNNSFYDKSSRIKELNEIKSPFNKDRLYQHEKEYRFVFSKINQESEDPIISLKGFDYSHLIVFVPSSIPDWKFNLIDELMKKFKLNIKITKSSGLTKKELAKYEGIYLEYHLK